MAVSDYSSTVNNNTSISGINIAEGCSPAGLNNALRQMMADIKDLANSLDIGSDVLAYSAKLQTIVDTTFAADQGIYFTGENTATNYSLTATGRSLVGQASLAAMRTYLELGGAALIDTSSTTTNFATTSPNLLSTRGTTAAYIADEITAAIDDYKADRYDYSNEKTPQSGATDTNWTHGLAAAPTDVRGYLRCITAESGFSVGDIVHLSNQYNDTSNRASFISNATQITYRKTSLFAQASNGAAVILTPANWVIGVYANL